ncbi:type VII secretion integral membrane protein EccD [Streptomyces sp. B1866]|uniref:type VII secretion integral membrane protein EccD n=1 Tax=Streptomyces sp. B1866 TaxID=3075431 RepID=UPI00288F0587|nr:type VII secretion integral membrane protein EccD [Streptomyces sp. B1866]MDT3398182.1 type VII secretion integral membrane protein EccD [Streptomyces sp. B1866]
MSSTASTGFCRVTVVAPDSRIDVALPDDIALADIYPEILRLTGQTPDPGAPVGYHLVRRDGTVLDGSRSLAAQRVLDGDLLSLRPFAESLPPAVHDDVAEAIAAAVGRDRTLWNARLLRASGLFGGALLLVFMGFLLWFADPARHDMHSLPGVLAGVVGLLLAVFAGVRARVYEDRTAAVALGLAALPHVMIAGSGVLPLDDGEGVGRLQFLLGCVCVLVVSVALVAAMPVGDAPFVAAVVLSAFGTLATFCQILADTGPRQAAAVCSAVAVGAVAFLPAVSARAARLPIGYVAPSTSTGRAAAADFGAGEPDGAASAARPLPADRVAAQVRRGHELLLGLVAGCSAVVVGAGAVLGFADSLWAQLLALAAGLAMLLRARLFRYTWQVACVLGAGLVSLALLVLGLALNPPSGAVEDLLRGDHGPLDIRTAWLCACVALGAGVVVAVALIVPKKGLTPFWGRFGDLAEGALLLSVTPLCLAVMDVYSTARSMVGN